MSVAITIQLDAASQRALRDFPQFAARAFDAVAKEMDKQNQLSIGDISTKRLNFPKEGPTVAIGLRNITNRLRGSIRATPAQVIGTGVQSTIGSNVKYAAIHEFGGRTRPHKITARNGKALKLFIGGKVILRKSVNHPGSNMPARRYVSGVLEERADRYVQGFADAIARTFLSLGGAAV